MEHITIHNSLLYIQSDFVSTKEEGEKIRKKEKESEKKMMFLIEGESRK